MTRRVQGRREPGLLLLTQLLLHYAAAQQQVKVVTVRNGQDLVVTVAQWGLFGGSWVLNAGPLISMANVSIPSLLPGNKLFSSGDATLNGTTGPPYFTSVLDNAMKGGLIPPMQGATMVLMHSTFLNNCESSEDPGGPSGNMAAVFSTNGLASPTRLYRSITIQDCTIYVRHAELTRQVYLKTMPVSPFPQIQALVAPLFEESAKEVARFDWIAPHGARALEFSGSAIYAVNFTLRSYASTDDPLLNQMRAAGLVLPPSYCNGTRLPPGLVSAHIHPLAPAWVVTNTSTLHTALAEAIQYTQTTGLKYKLPPEVMLVGNMSLTPPPQPLPPLNSPMLLTGQVAEAPGASNMTMLDLQNTSAIVQLGPSGQLFIQHMVLRGLVQAPLASSPGIRSALPLAAISRQPGAAINSTNTSPDYIWLNNVTLVLPPDDYLALASLALDGTPSSIARCVDAAVLQRAAQLKQGIQSLSAWVTGPHFQQMLVLTSFQGWGINATSLQLAPAGPLPVLDSCSSSSSSQGSCGRLSCGALAGVVVGSLGFAALLLAACLLAKRHPACSRLMRLKSGSDWSHPSSIVGHWQQGSHTGSKGTGASSQPATSNGVASTCTASMPSSAGLASKLSAMLSQSKVGGAGVSVDGTEAQGSGGQGSGTQTESMASHVTLGGVQAASAAHKELHTLVQQRAMPLKPVGDTVSLTGVLGMGSHGTVYKGLWRSLHVALKTVVFQDNTESASDQAAPMQARAIMEAAICASVGHKNVVCTYMYDIKPLAHAEPEAGGLQIVLGNGYPQEPSQQPGAYKLYLIQELCDATLRATLDNGFLHDGTDERVDWEAVYSLLKDIAAGLAYLHGKGIVHGDLKPDNVLLKIVAEEADVQVAAKLADFGVSTHLTGSATHVSNYTCGTPYYVAPEVVRHKKASTSSDMFALGVIAWECATGCRPYVVGAEGDVSRNPLFPNFLADMKPHLEYVHLVERCLSMDPRKRPTAGEVAMHMLELQKQSHATKLQ